MKNADATYPLAPMQQGMWFNTLRDGNGTEILQIVGSFDEALDVAAFEEAWRATVAARPVLLPTHADATLLVVSADRIDLRAVEVTEKTLNAVDVPISGVIFNQFDESKRRGYGYGYDYKKRTSTR